MIIAARIIGGILLLAWVYYIFVARKYVRTQGSVAYATIFQFNILPFIVGVSLIITGRLWVLIVLPVAWILSRFDPLFFMCGFPLVTGWVHGSHIFESIYPNSRGWYWGGGVIGVVVMFIVCTIVTAIILVPPRDTYILMDE